MHSSSDSYEAVAYQDRRTVFEWIAYQKDRLLSDAGLLSNSLVSRILQLSAGETRSEVSRTLFTPPTVASKTLSNNEVLLLRYLGRLPGDSYQVFTLSAVKTPSLSPLELYAAFKKLKKKGFLEDSYQFAAGSDPSFRVTNRAVDFMIKDGCSRAD
jgi:hypothetical protein